MMLLSQLVRDAAREVWFLKSVSAISSFLTFLRRRLGCEGQSERTASDFTKLVRGLRTHDLDCKTPSFWLFSIGWILKDFNLGLCHKVVYGLLRL